MQIDPLTEFQEQCASLVVEVAMLTWMSSTGTGKVLTFMHKLLEPRAGGTVLYCTPGAAVGGVHLSGDPPQPGPNARRPSFPEAVAGE